MSHATTLGVPQTANVQSQATGQVLLEASERPRLIARAFGVMPLIETGDAKLHELAAPDESDTTESGWSSSSHAAAGEWYEARLKIERSKDGTQTIGYLMATSYKPERWWDGLRYGLRGDGTAVVRLSLPEFEAGLCCAMQDEWWTLPSFLKRAQDAPRQGQFLLWKDRDGNYGVLLPLLGADTTAHLRGEDGGIELRVSSYEDGRLRVAGPIFCAVTGREPYALIEKAYAFAMDVMGRPGRLRREKPFPPALNYLGWCTWDAFYREVSDKAVCQKLDEFKGKNVPIGFVLVDDGWYAIDSDRLVSTEADRGKFEAGLSDLFKRVKEDYGIHAIGLWHALTGYWSGVHPDNTLDDDKKQCLLQCKAERVSIDHDAGRAFRFFNAWHAEMRAAGADFVKVDGQGAIHRYSKNLLPITQASRQMEYALQGSIGVNFAGQSISCMSMGHELAWFWSLSNVTRSSTDYMIWGAESDPRQHAVSNVYNSVWLSELSYCDWDMFRTDQPSAEFQAALRVLSGGPIYVSDGVGLTQADCLRPLVLNDGRVLRCDSVGRPCVDVLFQDPKREPVALKVFNKVGEIGILGLFNVQQDDRLIEAHFRPSDVVDLAGTEFAVWSSVEKAGWVQAVAETAARSLPALGCEVLILSAISEDIAVIGVVDKLLAPAVVRTKHRYGSFLTLCLEEGGELVVFSRVRPRRVWVDGVPTNDFSYLNHWLSIEVAGSGATMIDVELEEV